MTEMRVCMDVENVDQAAAFYTRVMGLQIGRRFDEDWIELVGGPCPIDLLGKRAGSQAIPDVDITRDYRRHWTPVHLDFAVSDIRVAIERALAAGAKLEKDVEEKVYGSLALLSDPFGHGFCFLQFKGKGYNEVQETKNPVPEV